MQFKRPKEVYVGADAIPRLAEFCRFHTDGANGNPSEVMVVADRNTYAAQGASVVEVLEDHRLVVNKVIFETEEVVADAHHVLRLLIASDARPLLFVSVGAGTITDITRFVSHRTRNPFIAVPTAPSVDGFASLGAPLIVGGVKRTEICQAPLAIFADIETLARAPTAMIAAGFGDMMGKYTSIADWRLGHLLWNEPYDEEIAERTLAAVDLCVANARAIGNQSPAGLQALFDALIESGYCMLDFGSSRPASGAEHHHSHYWEMRLLQQGRPAVLHGAKVGVGTILVAKHYDDLRALSLPEAKARLAAATQPDPEEEKVQIRAAYGPVAQDVIDAQRAFLEMSAETYDAIKQRIVDRWSAIQHIAAQVPSAAAIEHLLQTVHGPTTAQELGFSDEEVRLAAANHHYLRERFTIGKMKHLYGL